MENNKLNTKSVIKCLKFLQKQLSKRLDVYDTLCVSNKTYKFMVKRSRLDWTMFQMMYKHKVEWWYLYLKKRYDGKTR